MINEGSWWCDVCGSLEGLWYPTSRNFNAVQLHFDSAREVAPTGRGAAYQVTAHACSTCAAGFPGGDFHTEDLWRSASERVLARWRFAGADAAELEVR